MTSLHCVHCSLEALQKYARRLAFLRLCTVKVIDLRGCCLQRVTSLKAQHTYVDSTFFLEARSLQNLLQAVPYLSEMMLDGNALLSCKDRKS